MGEPKKTALAMMGGCETGIKVQFADELCSSIDSEFHRTNVQEAAALVLACAVCRGNPEGVDNPELYPCPLLEDEADAILIGNVINTNGA